MSSKKEILTLKLCKVCGFSSARSKLYGSFVSAERVRHLEIRVELDGVKSVVVYHEPNSHVMHLTCADGLEKFLEDRLQKELKKL